MKPIKRDYDEEEKAFVDGAGKSPTDEVREKRDSSVEQQKKRAPPSSSNSSDDDEVVEVKSTKQRVPVDSSPEAEPAKEEDKNVQQVDMEMSD